MKRKYFSALLMGALTIAATSTVTSCKDYDDDIQNLQQQIDANKSAIEQISKLIKEGSVITSVDKATDGVTVKLSNGDTFTINNGKDGKNGVDGNPGTPGSVVTINEEGYWCIDGKSTGLKAKGEKGDQGEKGETGPAGPQGPEGPAGSDGGSGSSASAIYYVPNPDSGCFDKYKDGEKIESTTISYLSNTTVSGGITAVKDNETLKLYGVAGGTGQNKEVVISLSGDLTSLVFMPKLYLDGIEMIDYPYLTGNTLKQTPVSGAVVNHDNVTVKDLGVDYKDVDAAFNYGPAWPVEYHANPVNAKVSYANVAGFNVLNPAILYTRATSAELGVTSPEKNFAGTTLFNAGDDGVLTVGLQVAHPEKLNDAPTKNKVTDAETWNDANTVALKVKNSEGKEVVSDYALLQPTKAKIEGMVWTKNPEYVRSTTQPQTGDENCSLAGGTKTHVWDTPNEALSDARHAALELYYEDNAEIDLKEYVGVHLVKENIKDYMATSTTETLSPAKAKEWGLTFHFIPVMYKAGDNETSDSHFLKALSSDDTNGVFRAQNVDENLQEGKAAEASVGREPLVQVLVKNNEGKVVLDGYILIHITKQAKDNKVVNDWENQPVSFDQCNDVTAFQTTWEQFNAYMLTNQLNITKEEFDHLYKADMLDATNHKMNMYADPISTKGSMTPDNTIGDVLYTEDATGTTNHTWRWIIAAEQVEKLLHDKASVTITRYVRFNAIDNVAAKYPYIYVKMQTTITRKQLDTFTFGDRIREHWYTFNVTTPRTHGTDGIYFDPVNPFDGGSIATISRGIETTLDGNKPGSLNGKDYKYFFEPKDIVIKAQDGKEYTITTSGNGLDYNKIVCKYDATHKHDYSKFDEFRKVCAIDYGSGAFNNKYLYAVKQGVPGAELIAVLDQASGVIELKNVEYCQKLLNAKGYGEYNTMIQELSAYVGVVAKANNCNIAQQVTDGSFIVSWQRPINLITNETADVFDANTNGNTINILDHLKFYDWRGYANGKLTDANCEANQSNMWGKNLWYWAYYGIKSIKVDFTKTETTLNQPSGSWKLLSAVTKKCDLYLLDENDAAINADYIYDDFSIASFNSKDMNTDLQTYMNGHKKLFGRIHYTNNGDNVGAFKLKIPVIVGYEWGEFNTYIILDVKATIGHED